MAVRNPWIRRVLGSVTAQSSLFLVEREGVLSLVDAGGAGCVRHVLAAIRRAGRRPEDVRHIVLTHCHGDHTGEAKRLKGLTGAILVAGTADAGVIDGSESLPGVDRVYMGHGAPISGDRFRAFARDL